MHVCADPQVLCVASVKVSCPNITGQCVQPALRVCGKFEITEGPSSEFDEIGSDLTDTTIRL